MLFGKLKTVIFICFLMLCSSLVCATPIDQSETSNNITGASNTTNNGSDAANSNDNTSVAPASNADTPYVEFDVKNTESSSQQHEQDVAAVDSVAANNENANNQQSTEQQINQSIVADNKQSSDVTLSENSPTNSTNISTSSTGNQTKIVADNKNPFYDKKVVEVNVSGMSTDIYGTAMSKVKLQPGDQWSEEMIKADVQALMGLGWFYDVKVNTSFVSDGVKVEYSVRENPIVRAIQFKGNKIYDTEQLLALVNLNIGQPINTKEVSETVKAIENKYHNAGYVLAKVSDVNMSAQGILLFSINEGLLEGIKIQGNEKTKEYVILREFKCKVGEPLNAKDVKRSVENLNNLGYFEDVSIKMIPGLEPNAVILDVGIIEKKTGFFGIGGGYSQDIGLTGMLQLGDTNWRGTGDNVKVYYQFGGYAGGPNYGFSWDHPWVNDKGDGVSFSFYNSVAQYTDYGYQGNANTLRSTYNASSFGIQGGYRFKRDDYLSDYVTLSYLSTSYLGYANNGPINYGYPADPTYNNYIPSNFGITKSVIFSRAYDTRDNVYAPTDGTLSSATVTIAGLGGDFIYQKYSALLTRHYPTGSNHVFAWRLTGGYINGAAPVGAQFSLGGPDTLRGYNQGQFQGNSMYMGNVEYRLPLYKEMVSWVMFSDYGWIGSVSQFNVAAGGAYGDYGLGIRVSTPFGPIRLDYAFGQQGGMSQFSFGGQF